MKQPILIDRVINYVVLDNGIAKRKYAPSGSVPSVKNEDDVTASGSFNYISIVGMMFYLYGHTRPEIDFSVNFCAIYMYCTKHSNEEALK